MKAKQVTEKKRSLYFKRKTLQPLMVFMSTGSFILGEMEFGVLAFFGGRKPGSKARTNDPHIWLELNLSHMEGQCSHYCTIPTQEAGMGKWQNGKVFYCELSEPTQHLSGVMKSIYFNLTWSWWLSCIMIVKCLGET